MMSFVSTRDFLKRQPSLCGIGGDFLCTQVVPCGWHSTGRRLPEWARISYAAVAASGESEIQAAEPRRTVHEATGPRRASAPPACDVLTMKVPARASRQAAPWRSGASSARQAREQMLKAAQAGEQRHRARLAEPQAGGG